MHASTITSTLLAFATFSLGAPTSPHLNVFTKRGINCRGSVNCSQWAPNYSRDLANFIGGLNDNAWINNGAQIACIDNICAFLQGTGGAPGHSVKALAWQIVNHGCQVCGSVPLFYPSDNNDNDHGILTFNYVTYPCGKYGLC